jgi:hypothetical protein
MMVPQTTGPDVEIWARRVRRLLGGVDPELLAEFNYQPPVAMLASFLAPQTLEPRYKKQLDQRIANLTGIIKDLRHRAA